MERIATRLSNQRTLFVLVSCELISFARCGYAALCDLRLQRIPAIHTHPTLPESTHRGKSVEQVCVLAVLASSPSPATPRGFEERVWSGSPNETLLKSATHLCESE